MAALRSLFDDQDDVARPSGRAKDAAPSGSGVPQPSLIRRANGWALGEGNDPKLGAALPLLPDRPVEADEHRPHRYLALNELDGPDYDDAVAGADRAAVEREVGLYGRVEDVRLGWSKDAA